MIQKRGNRIAERTSGEWWDTDEEIGRHNNNNAKISTSISKQAHVDKTCKIDELKRDETIRMTRTSKHNIQILGLTEIKKKGMDKIELRRNHILYFSKTKNGIDQKWEQNNL